MEQKNDSFGVCVCPRKTEPKMQNIQDNFGLGYADVFGVAVVLCWLALGHALHYSLFAGIFTVCRYFNDMKTRENTDLDKEFSLCYNILINTQSRCG